MRLYVLAGCLVLLSVPASAETMVTSCYKQQHSIAAHRTYPFGTKLRVQYPKTGKSAIVTIRDRGPFIAGRQLDISCSLADELGMGYSVGRMSVTRVR